jgi:hypothetical protein
MNECLTSDALNVFLAGQFSTGQREGIELHLSRCRACRQRLVNLYEDSKAEAVSVYAPRWLKASVLRIPKNRRVTIPMLILGFRRHVAAAVAAVLVTAGVMSYLLLSESQRGHQLPPVDVLRQETEVSPAPQLLAPGSDAVIASDQIEFRWSHVPDASSYIFILLDEKGDIVFQTSTTEEHLTLNVSPVRFERGKPYFWYVEARLPDGTTVDSEIRKFVLN